ncbi:LPS export ABC transporter permease LptF [Orrella sp. 11846]|uniref:LPS export ABC transporter permease LptF n=1 Tax=Orrella sp. 11846 TaxID=3409913 RepID=UPI003B5C852D
MSLFKRAAVSEFASNASVVFSTLIIIWLSIVLVRLLGEAANGTIGADVVLGLTGLTTIAALPTVLAAAVFIGVLTTVSRSYRESEMVVWFTSGLSLLSWIRPALRIAVPAAIVVGLLTIFASPWSHRQIQEYRARFELRSAISQVTTGEFLELEHGARVILVEANENDPEKLGQVFVRIKDDPWHSVVVSDHAKTEVAPNGDRFLVLEEGMRYDLTPGGLVTRLWDFDEFAVRLDSKDAEQTLRQSREHALLNHKGRPTGLLLTDGKSHSDGQLMWRLAIPIATINLALLAIPMGAVNPRAGRSFDMLVAGLIALLYFNLINLSHSWINNQTLPFGVGVWLVHLVFLSLTVFLFWHRVRVRAPKNPSD